MLRLAFDFIITWRETRTRPNAYRIVMETVCFERKAFEEFAMKIERFIHRVEGIPIWI